MKTKNFLKKNKIINLISFYFGFYVFKITKKNFFFSYRSLVNLYCLTNGYFLQKINDKESTTRNSSISKDLTKINDLLKKYGYHKLKKPLEKKKIDALKKLSFELDADYNGEKIKFDPKNVITNKYNFNPNDLINNTVVQDLIMNSYFIDVARNYLGSEPIFDFSAMWWNTDSSNISQDAAQEYHFDLDRLKWLKMFIYLTNVDSDNGPHCYISGTHIPGSKPIDIVKRGYVRINDRELEQYYDSDRIIEVIGPEGTIVFGDTLCWHKGKKIISGNRLVFQLEFTSSLFGLKMPKFEVNTYSKEFRDFCNENKFYTQNIKLI